ncbi:MAG: hypothetical protein ACFE8E_03805 [Candidatus Hodarchaeota archaeon]
MEMEKNILKGAFSDYAYNFVNITFCFISYNKVREIIKKSK